MSWLLKFANWLDNMGVDDFAAGFGDSITSGFGLFDDSLTNMAREALEVNGSIDFCSSAYGFGEFSGFVIGSIALVGASGQAAGISIFAKGGKAWHIGLEFSGQRNIIHIGRHIQFGVHVAIDYVGPKFAKFHFYFQKAWPFLRFWKP